MAGGSARTGRCCGVGHRLPHPYLCPARRFQIRRTPKKAPLDQTRPAGCRKA